MQFFYFGQYRVCIHYFLRVRQRLAKNNYTPWRCAITTRKNKPNSFFEYSMYGYRTYSLALAFQWIQRLATHLAEWGSYKYNLLQRTFSHNPKMYAVSRKHCKPVNYEKMWWFRKPKFAKCLKLWDSEKYPIYSSQWLWLMIGLMIKVILLFSSDQQVKQDPGILFF